ATIKAFAVATRRPCVAVSTLAAIALGAGPSTKTVAVLGAGRGEVYAQMFSVANGSVQALDRESHIDPKRLVEKYRKVRPIMLAGDRELRLMESLRLHAKESGIAFSEGEAAEQVWTITAQAKVLAKAVATLALADYCRGTVIEPHELRANYVRPSDAEINEQWLQQSS